MRDSSGDLAGKKRKDPDNPNCKRGGLVRREYRLVPPDYGNNPRRPVDIRYPPTRPYRAAHIPRGSQEVHKMCT